MASLLVVSLGKALTGTPTPLCRRQVAYSYFTGLHLRSCKPSMSQRETLGCPPVAVPLAGGGGTSHS